MRWKATLITRCLSTGICMFSLILLIIIAKGVENTEEKMSEEQTAYRTDCRTERKPDDDQNDPSQDNRLKQDIGNGTEIQLLIMQTKQQAGETGDTSKTLLIKLYRKEESEPFQELQTDYVEQDREPFNFRDLNADGYLDLIFTDKSQSDTRILASYLWSESQQKFVRGLEELDGCNYNAVSVDKINRRIQVGKTGNHHYENYTYQWSNEMDHELVKAFYNTRTDSGTSVRIVSFYNGDEQILMDYEYDTRYFPYYFDRYSYNDSDIFRMFYEDDPVWEKTIHAESLNTDYTLYYAQKMQYDSEDATNVTGYEGHLWVTDKDTGIVKRLFWQSEAPYTRITWEEPILYIQYADGSNRTCTISEILKSPAQAVYEKSMQIDFRVKEYAIDTKMYDAVTDKIYKDAYYRAISGKDMVRTSEKEEVYLKEYWIYQGDSRMEITDETFLGNLIDNTKFYYMDFDGDGMPELIMNIIGDGLHILKYLPDEEIVEISFGYERMPYFNLLGSGQLYYNNGMLANKELWEYDIVDANGQDSPVIFFMKHNDYKPHKEDEDEWWDTAYFVYLDEELGMVQVDEKRYQEITRNFFDAIEHAVTATSFEEIFGENR